MYGVRQTHQGPQDLVADAGPNVLQNLLQHAYFHTFPHTSTPHMTLVTHPPLSTTCQEMFNYPTDTRGIPCFLLLFHVQQ